MVESEEFIVKLCIVGNNNTLNEELCSRWHAINYSSSAGLGNTYKVIEQDEIKVQMKIMLYDMKDQNKDRFQETFVFNFLGSGRGFVFVYSQADLRSI